MSDEGLDSRTPSRIASSNGGSDASRMAFPWGEAPTTGASGRRTRCWIACVVPIILALATLRSFYRSQRGWEFGIGAGGISVGWEKNSWCPPGWSACDNDLRVWLWIPGFYSNDGGWGVCFPLCLPIFIITVARLVASSLRQPMVTTRCSCGYDLAGNTTGTCPECGTPIGTST